jgi:glycosyltransferase involved in cell wall biosynthesis
MKIVHLISGLLSAGGAQTMVLNLVTHLDPAAFATEVISIAGIGPVGERLRARGTRVRTLATSRRLPSPAGFVRLVRWLRAEKPDLVQTWQYHADLVGAVAGHLAGRIPVVWNIRHTSLQGNKPHTRWTALACARLSRRLPRRIVCCSEASRAAHVALGYDASKMAVVPNGFDLQAWKPDPGARAAVRTELGIAENDFLVGLVARFHPQKDQRTFVAAAARLGRELSSSRFLLCGDGVTMANPELAVAIRAAGIGPRTVCLGERTDVPRIDAALDVATCSSYTEGFPNAIGEAMACEVPCVVTDVGDARALVGDTGVVVPPREPEALAAGWRELAALGPDGRRRLGSAARQRIAEHFSLDVVTARYAALYRETGGES